MLTKEFLNTLEHINWHTYGYKHTSWLAWVWRGSGIGEVRRCRDALGSPAGTDGLNSAGMITERMEVRNQRRREKRKRGKGVGGAGGGWVRGRQRA